MQSRGDWSYQRKNRRPRLLVIKWPQLAPNDVNVLGGLNTERYTAARHSVDHDRDPVANHNLLADSSSQN